MKIVSMVFLSCFFPMTSDQFDKLLVIIEAIAQNAHHAGLFK